MVPCELRCHTLGACPVCLLQHGYNYGQPDYILCLPQACSEICLGSTICCAFKELKFTVLTFLQPRVPRKPIVHQKKDRPLRQTPEQHQGL